MVFKTLTGEPVQAAGTELVLSFFADAAASASLRLPELSYCQENYGVLGS